jgi:hypothetical protein
MHSLAAAATAFFGLSALVSAAPLGFTFPLANGFPKPNSTEVTSIEQAAGGTLSNAPPPPSISQEGITNLKLIAFNELFEVAFFSELLSNITNNVPGYVIDDRKERRFLIDTITAVLAVSFNIPRETRDIAFLTLTSKRSFTPSTPMARFLTSTSPPSSLAHTTSQSRN